MKIAHLADLHLGYRAYHRTAGKGINLREYDVAQAFNEAINKIITVQAPLVLIAGDMFHTVRPPNATVTFTFHQIKRLQKANDAEIVIIAGNHETPRSRDTGNILKLFEEIPGVTVAYNQLVEHVPQNVDECMCITCVPHNAVLQRPKLQPTDKGAECNILLIHAAHEKYKRGVGAHVLHSNDIKASDWDYVALGDYHSYTVIEKNMIYPGAIERTSTNIWAEAAEDKGFVLYDTRTGEHEFAALDSPRTVVDLGPFNGFGMSAADLDDFIETELMQTNGSIEDKIVRIKILDVPAIVRKDLDYVKLREYRNLATHLSLDIRKPDQWDFQSGAKLTTKHEPLETAFIGFVDERYRPGDEGVDREALKKLGLKYLGEADGPSKDEPH